MEKWLISTIKTIIAVLIMAIVSHFVSKDVSYIDFVCSLAIFSIWLNFYNEE